MGPVCVRLGLTVRTARCLSRPPPPGGGGVVSALCDLNQGPCPFFLVQGFGFLDYPSLTCHFTLAENNSMVNTTAILRSEEEVSCPAYRGSLAISNDGVTLSLSVRVVVYDSLCEVCTDTACTQRNDVCRINNKCYADGFIDPTNANQICDVTSSKTQWATLNVQNIVVKNYLFIRIIGRILVTRTYNITIGGTGTPALIPGFAGGNAISVDGNQFLSYRDVTDTCFGDVERCTKGVTIRFNLRLKKHSSKCYVFSNGGEEVSNYGRHPQDGQQPEQHPGHPNRAGTGRSEVRCPACPGQLHGEGRGH
ncbi:uncharacterized protein LOC144618908 [Crassostrea virginica]